ncbi:MAG: RluA family pseudouridine synthase [Planctomycetes bacterium]|nr:RluA family pseudouridine synthase [Planctomycetota bacterium]MCG2682728.1 RluA family pseudouridine synthase [Planctomycetales bacterium]
MTAEKGQLFRVLPRQVDETISAAMRQWMPGSSWSDIRRLLKSRRVLVGGNLCSDAGYRLRLKDVVKLLPHSIAPPGGEQNVRIRHLDKYVVVVEKPPCMTSTHHPDQRRLTQRRRQFQPTLDELLPRLIARAEGRRDESPVRAVHRLDRETSGLMVFARTAEAQRHLQHQFRVHSIIRRYVAVMRGFVEEQTITSRLVRDRGDGRRGSATLPNVGKTAITHVRPVERLGDYTLVECRLETGRTHQIRIHLSEAGHPLCGDKVYWRPLFKPCEPDASGAARLALAAVELGFEHPATGQAMNFETPLPPDLAKFVRRLRKAAGG